MWVIDNSDKVLEVINDFNDNLNIQDMYTYDFSTLFSNIPLKDLKRKMKWVIEQVKEVCFEI